MTTDAKAQVRDILMRSNDVRDWPADEQALHRGWKGDFASRFAAVTELRVQKILDAVHASEPAPSSQPQGAPEDACPECGAQTEYVCGPDGNGGGMYCWTCHDANRDATTDTDGRVYEFPIPGDVNLPAPPSPESKRTTDR